MIVLFCLSLYMIYSIDGDEGEEHLCSWSHAWFTAILFFFTGLGKTNSSSGRWIFFICFTNWCALLVYQNQVTFQKYNKRINKKDWSCYCYIAVSALKEVRRKLKDPFKNLRNWKKTDPCEKEWTGVICTKDDDDQDAYLHVQEL